MSNLRKAYGVVTCVDTPDENISWFSDKADAIEFYREAITYTEAIIVKQLRVEITVSSEDE